MNSRRNQDDNEITNSILKYDENQLASLKESLGFYSPLHEKSVDAPCMSDHTDCDMDDHSSLRLDLFEHILMDDDISDEEMDKLIDKLLEEYYPDVEHEEVRHNAGRRLLVQSEFDNNREYSQAVSGYMQDLLRQRNLHPVSIMLDDDRELISYTTKLYGVKAMTNILVKHERCSYDIITNLVDTPRKGRTALIDHYCNKVNQTAQFSTLLFDYDMQSCAIRYSTCFYGAFSEEVFSKYLDANNEQVSMITGEYNEIATAKKLSPEQRRLSRRLIFDLTANLPSQVKPENREIFKLINDYAGVPLNTRQKKLLNYFLEGLTLEK